jgi:alkanesulfonate monooxygenase SsuD/methylene tetrahydromethanopterin reductase-like flavin-dependent oxidoreductase (luciferase family)
MTQDLAFGLGLRGLVGVGEQAAGAESAGFDYVFCGEHMFFHAETANAFVSLAAAAAATTQIQLLSAVTLLPLYPAAMVAKMASVLDVISDGRFHLGVGVGGEFPPEFAAAGIPVAERGARANESLEVISRLFTGEPVQFSGRWSSLNGVALSPGPRRPGGPPLWVAGRRDAAMRRAGRWANVWMPYMYTPEQLHDSLATVRSIAAGHGREPSAVSGSIYVFVTIDDDRLRARRIAAEVVGGGYGQDFSRLHHYLVAGTPSDCVVRLREYANAGASSIQMYLACPPEHERRMMDALVTEVLPGVRDGGQRSETPSGRRGRSVHRAID